jgi:tetratricopeptide (TPR) repeat protein
VIHAKDPALLGLPWELLKDPKRPTPLALDPDFAAIDRTFEVEGAATELPPGESLRVLMVIARPEGIKDVGYQMVARPLLERLQAVRGQVALEVLRPPTLDALEDQLRRAAEKEGRPYHVLHFDGHGVLQRGTGGSFALPTFPHDRYRAQGEGYVVFEKATGGDEAVAAEHFARLVRTGRVPLVVLNACQSGAMSEAAEAAVATRLLMEGAASVVAMGYSVYAVAAAEFMAAFYQALFEGKTVAAAVDAGRERLARRSERPSPKGPLPLKDWMVPVHYRRGTIAFPQLKATPARPGLSFDAALDRMRQAPKPETTAAAAVPAEGSIEPVGRFVGRDSFLYTLERACRYDRAILVHGPGGTGKTELAKAFARWWRDTGGLEDPAWVFFYSFEPGLPSFGLDGVVNALGIRLFGPDFIGRTEGRQQRLELLLDTLQQHRMLLIWDNFESVHSLPEPGGATPPLSDEQRAEITAFLAVFRGEGFGSALLVISRTDEPWLSDVRRVELGGLSPQEAAEYADNLLAAYPRAQAQRRDKAFGELMEWLAGHPLSLKLILPQLEESPAAALLTGLRGMGALPAGFEASAGRLRSLGASVKYSFDHLSEEVRRLLPALSLFEGVADGVVLTAFSRAADVPARFAGAGEESWRAVLAATARVGLLTLLWGAQYGVHPALPAYLAAQWRREAGRGFEEERRAARRALLAAYAVFGAWLLQQIQAGSAEGALAVIERQRRTMGQLLAFALEEGRYAEAQQILQPLNAFWDARGLAEEAKGWVDRVRQAVEGTGGAAPDFGSEAGALWLFAVTNDANWAIGSGDLARAERAYEDICRTLEAAPPADSRDHQLAVVYHQLGMVAQLRGDLAAAEDWYKKALTIFEALGDHPGMARSYHQLGMVAQYRGDLAAAEDWYKKALTIFEARGDRPGMAASYHQLGMVAQLRGDLAAAEDWYKKALTIFEALGDRPGMAKSYGQLGTVAHFRGDLAAAEDWYKKALTIFEALGNCPEMAGSYHQLSMVAHFRGDLAAAEDWCREALAIRERLGDRWGMARSYHQLGMVAQDRGDLATAEDWYKKALTIFEALGDHPGMANIYGQLGLLAEVRVNLAATLDWMVRCVALFAEFPHPSTGPGPHHLARLTRVRGMAALQESWQRCTGRPLPANVRAGVERMIREASPTEG